MRYNKIFRKSVLNIYWKDWCWSWSSNTLATWWKESTHWKRLWCWERLKAGREGDERGWDGWMASPTRWTWVWTSSGSWWWAEKPGVLQSMRSQRVQQDLATQQQWLLLLSHFSRVRLFATRGLKHARPPCPSPTPGACSNSCPSSRWCHPTISSSVVPFFSHLSLSS